MTKAMSNAMSDKASHRQDSLEAAVAAYRDLAQNKDDSARHRIMTDRAFAGIIRRLEPRIRYFIRQYGLTDHDDDARQCCAIAAMRALDGYDSDKAGFATFVSWQMRGELQALRFRLRTDQRSSARKAGASTQSLEALAEQGGSAFEAWLADADAVDRVEAHAADHMAARFARRLIDQHMDSLHHAGLAQLAARPRAAARPQRVRRDPLSHLPAYVRAKPGTIDPRDLAKFEARLARDRAVITAFFMGEGDAAEPALPSGITRERSRQIARDAARNMAQLVQSDERLNALCLHGPRSGRH